MRALKTLLCQQTQSDHSGVSSHILKADKTDTGLRMSSAAFFLVVFSKWHPHEKQKLPCQTTPSVRL